MVNTITKVLQSISRTLTKLTLVHKRHKVILVQGATGQLGFETVKALSQYSNVTIKAGIRSLKHSNLPKLVDLGVQTAQFDSELPIEMVNSLRGVTTLVLIPPTSQVRADQVMKMVNAARKSKSVRHIVLLSVTGAANCSNTFSKQWKTIERYIQSTKIPYTFVRSNLFMENILPFSEQIKHGVLPSITGNGVWAPVARKDVAEALAAVATSEAHKRATYELTGPSVMSAEDQAEILTGVLGKRVRTSSIRAEDYRKLLRDSGMAEWEADGMMEINELISENKMENVSLHLKHLLGRNPSAFDDFVEYYRSEFQ